MRTLFVCLLLALAARAETLGDRIFRLHDRCAIADLKEMKSLVDTLSRDKSALPYYFALALPRNANKDVRAWIAGTLINEAKGPLLRGCVEAVGIWKITAASDRLVAIVDHELSRKPFERNVMILYEAARAAGHIGGKARAAVYAKCIGHADWRIELAAAECIPERLDPQAANLFAHENVPVRETAALAATRPYAPELIYMITEKNRRIRRAGLLALERLSGKELGDEPGVWREEFGNDRKPIVPATPAVETLHLVLDTSLQMQWPEFPPTRLQVGRREIDSMLTALREPTRFNVMAFGGTVRSWKRAPVVASFETRKGAGFWLDKYKRGEGSTNTFEALLRHEGADEVLFVAGGIPNVGQHRSYAAMYIHLRNWNRLHRVRFHTIAVSLTQTPKSKEFAFVLKRIADESGGRFRHLTKPFR
jgi:hypothetical protein